MKSELARVAPAGLEARRMEIIRPELKAPRDPEHEAVILRASYTTADFDYAETLTFSPGAVQKGVEALLHGASVVTDTTMALSGINKRVLHKLGGEAYNFIADPEVAQAAKERGVTRAAVSMEHAAALGKHLIYAIGNAPTALVRLYELWQEGQLPEPALIIGVPVGFVNVVEAKELICTMDCPYIVARGRKGGSNLAAAIVNALLYTASKNGKRVTARKQAILAVSFGTTYPATLEKTIAATEDALAAAYPGWPVFRAFTSGMIIKKLQSRDGVQIDNVAQAMARLEAAGHLHQVPGGIQAGAGFKIGPQLLLADAGHPAEKPPGRLAVAGQVQLRAVAGGEQHAAGDAGLLLEARQRPAQSLAGEGQLLPEGQGRAVAVQAGHGQAHFHPSLAMTSEK